MNEAGRLAVFLHLTGAGFPMTWRLYDPIDALA